MCVIPKSNHIYPANALLLAIWNYLLFGARRKLIMTSTKLFRVQCKTKCNRYLGISWNRRCLYSPPSMNNYHQHGCSYHHSGIRISLNIPLHRSLPYIGSRTWSLWIRPSKYTIRLCDGTIRHNDRGRVIDSWFRSFLSDMAGHMTPLAILLHTYRYLPKEMCNIRVFILKMKCFLHFKWTYIKKDHDRYVHSVQKSEVNGDGMVWCIGLAFVS